MGEVKNVKMGLKTPKLELEYVGLGVDDGPIWNIVEMSSDLS